MTEEQFTAGQVFQHYEVIRLLGRGGMGEVYLVKDLTLKRKAALKLLQSDLSQDRLRINRFRREATSAATLNHPGICTIYEIGEAEGLTYIAMEYVEGTTLRDRLRSKPFTPKETLDIAVQIAEALNEAGKKGIVHRDIKSANIVITTEGRVKVLDFGLAKQLALPDDTNASGEETASQLTHTGVVMGTVAYMSPEQASGMPVDHRSDLFSFGVVLYEMLSGRLPFQGNTWPEVIGAILYKEAVPLKSDVPVGLRRVVNKLLEKEKEQRFQSAGELLADLNRIKPTARSLPISALVAIIVMIGVAAGLGISYLLRSQSGTAPATVTQPQKQISSLVALPCKVFGPPEANYLTDAVPSTFSTLLAQMEGIETKLPPTSFELEKIGGDLDKLASAYGVKAFVISSVTARQDQLTLNVQLVNAADRSVLWSRQLEGNQETYNDLAKEAAEGIRATILPRSAPLKSVGSLARSSKAELEYQKGVYYRNRFNNLHKREDFERSLKAYTTALESDAQLADAAADIGFLYAIQLESGTSPENVASEMDKWVRRALEIDPKNSTALAGLVALEYEGHSKASFSKIIRYSLKAAFYGQRNAYAHHNLGHAIEIASSSIGLEAVRHARKVDPLYLYPILSEALCFYNTGKTSAGLSVLDQALELEPDMTVGLFSKIFFLLDLKRIDEALRLRETVRQHIQQQRCPPYYGTLVDHALALSQGNTKQWEETYRNLLQGFENSQFTSHDLSIVVEFTVPFLAKNGKKNETIEILDRSLQTGYTPAYDFFILNSYFDPLRQNPRFLSIVTTSRKQFDELILTLQDARSRGEMPGYLEKPMGELLANIKSKERIFAP